MKTLNLLLGVILFSSLVLGSGNAYYTGSSALVCGRELQLINTGIDDQGSYAIISVNGQESKIYQGDDKRINEISIYVEGVSDDVGAQHDSAILSLACKNNGLVGSKEGDDWYKLKEGESSFAGPREFKVLRVDPDAIQVSVNNDIARIALQERTSVGGLSIFLDKVDGKTVILRIKPATALGYVTGNSVTGLVIGDIEFGLKSYFENLFSFLKLRIFNFS